jgi:hypothetical protein
MKMISIPFAVTKGGKISEEEYLPGLLLEVERNKKGGGLFKKTGEIVKGIAELNIPLLVSFYARRERGIVVLHHILAHKKTLYFPEIVLNDLDVLKQRFSQAEMDYGDYTKEFSALIASITEIKKNARELDSLPNKAVLDNLKEFMGFAYEKEETDAFLFDTAKFDENQEIPELQKMLDYEEEKLSGLSSHLDALLELLSEKKEVLKGVLEEECKEIMEERNKKRRETIDAFKIKAEELKQLKRVNDDDEQKLLAVRMGRRETIEYQYNQARDALPRTSDEEHERLKKTVAEYKDQLEEIGREIREIKQKAESRRNELHRQLLALDEKLENFDNETKSISYEYKEKMQKLEHLCERFADAKETYVITAKNELTDRINDLSVNMPLPDVAEDMHDSFFVYIPVYLAVLKDEKAGTQRYQAFPPKYIRDEMKSLASSFFTKFKKMESREGLDALLTETMTTRLMNEKDLELNVLEHIANNSITDSSSNTHAVVTKGAEKQKHEGKLSDKEYGIIKSMLEGEK